MWYANPDAAQVSQVPEKKRNLTWGINGKANMGNKRNLAWGINGKTNMGNKRNLTWGINENIPAMDVG